MGNGEATPADRAEFAIQAATAAGAVPFGQRASVDVDEGLGEEVADERGEFSAGVDFAVGQDGDEIEGRPAAEPGAAAGQRSLLLCQQQVEKRRKSSRKSSTRR